MMTKTVTQLEEENAKLTKLWAGFMQVVRDAEWCMFEVDLSDFMDEVVVKQCGLMTYEEWDEKKHGPDGLDIEGDEGDMIYVLTDLGKNLEAAGSAQGGQGT